MKCFGLLVVTSCLCLYLHLYLYSCVVFRASSMHTKIDIVSKNERVYVLVVM